MIISTNITRNKKPAQAVYQMANPEPVVQNEPKVDSEVVLGDDEDNTNTVEPAADSAKDQESVSSTETEQINTSEVVEEGAAETTLVQEQSSEPEPQPVQESEQPQEEHVEETPKKKASSKKK